MRMLRYSSSRFQPRINDYTYPQRRAHRMTARQQAWCGSTESEGRPNPTHASGADVTR